MKIEAIKTEKQFWEFANNWHQRAHKLREVWQDEKESVERKVKAARLWEIMTYRVMKLLPIATKLNSRPLNRQMYNEAISGALGDFPRGGHSKQP